MGNLWFLNKRMAYYRIQHNNVNADYVYFNHETNMEITLVSRDGRVLQRLKTLWQHIWFLPSSIDERYRNAL